VWRIVALAILATLVVVGLGIGGYTVYRDKTNQIANLKSQRLHLQANNAALKSELSDTKADLAKANTGLAKAKKNLTTLNKNLVAANKRAADNYNVGYSAGSDAGYSSGREAGLVAGSDQLTCSDDPDVTWLPYCNG
jgi:Tfp pilus assembly protein PilX